MTRRLLLGCAAVVLGILVFQPIRSSSFWKFTRMPSAEDQARVDMLRQKDVERTIAQHPQMARPMASYRVHEEKKATGTVHRGGGYVSETTDVGLHFEIEGTSYIDLAASRLEQGDHSIELTRGTVSNPAFGDVRIDRGALVEQYIFENTRTEQILRIPQPIGKGELRVQVAVRTDLTGPVLKRRRFEAAWSDTTLQDGGIAFSNPRGEQKVAYHGAMAVDAAGHRVDLDPSFSPGQIALAVPADFMAQAVYPVAIDPWLELNFSASGAGMSQSAGLSQTPSVAVVGGGNPYVAWSEQVKGLYQIYFRYWNGIAWVPLGTSDTGGGVSATSGNAINPSVCVASPGPYIAWQDDSSGTSEIYFKRWDGQKWSELQSNTPPQINPTTFNSSTGQGVSFGIGTFSGFPQVAVQQVTVNSKGLVEETPVIAYESTTPNVDSIIVVGWFPGDVGQQQQTDNNGNIIQVNFPPVSTGWYAFGGNLSGEFYPTLQMSGTTAPFVSQKPTLRINPLGNPVVSFTDTRNGTHDIMVAQFVPTAISPNVPIFPTARPPDFAFGNWVGFNGGFNSFAAGGITGNAPGNVNFSINSTMELDPAGNPNVAWEQVLTPGTSSNIFFKHWTGAAWAENPVGSATGGGISNFSAVARISATPSIAMDGLVPWVAWQDNEAGNAEIYVRRLTGGAWNEVGFQSNSATVTALGGIGGISQTLGKSLTPSLAHNGNGSVAWQDDSSAGLPQIYVRRFFENQPVLLRQTTPLGATAIPFGAGVNGGQIELRATAFSEDINRLIHMQVEVVPVGNPFVGNVTVDTGQTGGAVGVNPATHLSTTEMVANVQGLINGVNYQWRARTVDDLGQQSGWVSAGGSDGITDFGVTNVVAVAPGTPSNLNAALINGIITLTWTAPAGGADSYNVKRSTVQGGGGYPPATIISLAGSVTNPTYQDLSAAVGVPYFYVVSAVRGGLESSTNSNEVTITLPGAGIGASQDQISKHRCGLVGGEALALLGLGIFLRRRRRS